MWDLDVDFISVGSGIGGLAGAVTAAAGGAEVLVLEKGPCVGGVTALSTGELWVAGSHLETQAGIRDSWTDGARYIASRSLGCAVPELTRALCRHSPATLRFLDEECGVGFRIIDDMPDYFWPEADGSAPAGRLLEIRPFPGRSLGAWQDRTVVDAPFTHALTNNEVLSSGGFFSRAGWDEKLMNERMRADVRCMGVGLTGALLKAALGRGVDVRTNSSVVELLTESGRVTGAKVLTDGGVANVRSRAGILLATGGYDWNRELRRLYDAEPEHRSQVPGTINGDHLVLAGRLGAKVATVPAMTRLGYGTGPPGQRRWLSAAVAGLPHAVIVNRHGRRFADESFQSSYSFAVRVIDGSTLEWANRPCWMVVDGNFCELYSIGLGSDGKAPEGMSAVCAATLAELAGLCGIDPAGLEDEISRFNEFVRAGVDEAFHRGERQWARKMNGDPRFAQPCMGEVCKPPFWAVQLTPVGSGLGAAGLACDVMGRVTGYDGDALPGLYAAGNSMALLDLGGCYQSGAANTRGMTFGSLAARHALGLEAPEDC